MPAHPTAAKHNISTTNVFCFIESFLRSTDFTIHSTTISVSEDEWLRVANWVYERWDIIGGLSFLPRTEHVYRLAPYEAITEERYNELVKNFPVIDFSKLVLYEYEDATTGAKELACVSGTCEIDIPMTLDGQPIAA